MATAEKTIARKLRSKLNSDKRRIFSDKVLDELDKCAACGTCHSVCPVYNLSKDDSLSARGRIHLLKAIVEGRLESGKVSKNIFNQCLLCYACETVCPSGVKTSEIWIQAREYFSRELGSGLKGKAIRKISDWDSLTKAAKMGRGLQRLAPEKIIGRDRFAPEMAGEFVLDQLPERVAPAGNRKLRVGYFVGCVSNFFLGEIALAAIHVLSILGCEVIIPKQQVCCGAPAFNNGEFEAAKRLARKNIEVFLKADVDCITSADATCGGSFCHEYNQLMHGENGFEEFSMKYREIHGLISELGWDDGIFKRKDSRVTYHDSCHLRHTQGVREVPRRIIQSLPGVSYIEMRGADLCCGFGGSFSLFHAAASTSISSEKLQYAEDTGAEEIAAGSPGCILRLKDQAAKSGSRMRVKHTVELINERLSSNI